MLSRITSFYLSVLFFMLLHVFSTFVHAVDFIDIGPPFENIEKIGHHNLANITHIMQDSLGFIWFTNGAGLLRFDGHDIKVFPELEQFNGLNIDTLLAGESGRLWITSTEKGKGLALFDSKSARLSFVDLSAKIGIKFNTEYEPYPALAYKNGLLYLANNSRILVIDEASLALKQTISLPIAANDSIIRLRVTNNGDIWYSTQRGKGVSRVDDKGVHSYQHLPTDKTTINAELVLDIFEDSKGRLWFSTPEGLNLFQPRSESFKRYTPIDISKESNKHHGPRANALLNVVEDAEGDLWLGLFNSGIVKFQPDSETFQYYPHINNVNSTLLTNSIYWGGVFIDRQQTIWAITKKGIGKLSKVRRGIQIWENIDKDNCNLDKIHQTKTGFLFACNKALYQFNNNQVSHLKNFNQRIFSIYQGSDRLIWVGTANSGIHRYDLTTDTSKQYNFNLNANDPDTTNTIERIRAGVSGRFYGILQNNPLINGSVIIHYNSAKDEFINIPVQTKLSDILDIDKTKMLLISSYSRDVNQLHMLDKNSQTIKQLPIATGIVYAALKWHNQLWLSTEKLGLIGIDIKTEQWQQLAINTTERITGLYLNSTADTLYLNIKQQLYQFISITQDKINSRCISCMLPLDSPQINDPHFGQLKNSFGLLLPNHEFLLSAENKLMTFPINSDVSNTSVSPLLLTDYKVLGKSVVPHEHNKKALLTHSIEQTKHIDIPPQTTFFSFSFARVGVAYPAQIKYAYKLVGLNTDWVYTDASRAEVVYSLLPAGNYTFKVKASHEKGQWIRDTSPLSLSITVLPPWWETWWAYSFYLSCFLYLFWWFYRTKLAEKEHQATVELTKTKEQLFANISHEFRTPLTLILGPAKVIKTENDAVRIQQNISLIERNAQRLLAMVDQLLQLAQLKELQTKPAVAQQVSTLCQFVLKTFAVVAQEKKITLEFNSIMDESWWVSGEQNALETILYNLFTNAIKFTQVGGHISLEVTTLGQWLEFKVTDSGCGIAEHEQTKIFDRFTRLENNEPYVPGAGIGLALVKELVLIWGGTISVNSRLKDGASFIFTLPKVKVSTVEPVINQTNVHDIQQQHQQAIEQLSSAIIVQDDLSCQNEHSLSITEHSGDSHYVDEAKPKVLIVDDNQEMRAFITQFLVERYQVFTAEHGQQALLQALKYSPDIIITDVMMPVMDGFELLTSIRNDMAISHIPVILLTAKDDQQSKLKGLSDLADDYITKPFDGQELLMRMQRLLGIRTILQKRFVDGGITAIKETVVAELSENAEITNKTVNLSNVEQQFLQRFNESIEDGYTNPKLTLPMISAQLAMSERQLQRKLKALSGINFSEILREYRLTQGQKLLNNGEQIAVIADQVGFTSSSYFVRCFKAKYGKTPNDYRKAS